MTTPNLSSDHTLKGQQGRKKTPEELEAEISQTRSAITEDIKALGEKLSPENLKQGAKDVMRDAKEELKQGAKEALRDAKEEAAGMLRNAKDHAIESVSETIGEIGDRARQAGHVIRERAREASYVTTDFVSANALPLALISIGASWLMLTIRHQRNGGSNRYLPSNLSSDRYYRSGRQEQPDDFLERKELSDGRNGYQYTARRQQYSGGRSDQYSSEGRGSHLVERVQEAASDIGHRASDMTYEARDRLDAAQLRTREFTRENPVAVGLLALAAGVGIAMLFQPLARKALDGPTRQLSIDRRG